MKTERNPFRKIGALLVDRFGMDQPGKGNRALCQELTALAAGKKSAVREYYIRKMELLILVLAAGAVLGGVGFFVESGAERRIADRVLERPGYGEGDKSEELNVQVKGADEAKTVEITVQERKYTKEEKGKLLEEAAAALDEMIPGENSSMDEVRLPLVFPSALLNGAVTAEWTTIPYGIIEEDGSIIGAENEDGTLVEIQAALTCGEEELDYTAYAKVFPPLLPEEERLLQSIQKEADAADDRDKHKETVTLPDQVDGIPLSWERPSDNLAQTVLALTLLLAVCVYVGNDQMIHRKAEYRKNQLAVDYPDLMWKLAMLIGAGLTIRGAFARVAAWYRAQKGVKPRYAYEEMAGACYEMESGVPEAEAYERFGRRCGLPEYVRLGSYLAQNLKKGSRGLAGFLEQEAASSLEERKNRARKMGEQAGTKLLFPMMLMLGIVLVILMVPAFLSF